jgi:hypothetical protein
MKAYRPSEVVVNNTLFIDKTENAVGINTMTPKANLDVVGKIQCSDDLSVGGIIRVEGGLSLTNVSATGNLVTSANISATGNTPTSGNISAGRNITASGNIGIGVLNPTNRLNIASNVPYPNLTSASLRTSAQLHISQTTDSGSLYIANGYTAGIGTGSVIQSSDYFSSSDHGTPLFLNPLGGGIYFGTSGVTFTKDVWNTSSDGALRTFYGTNSHTYYQTRGDHIFRKAVNSSSPYLETDIFTIYNNGNVLATGNVTITSDARIKTNIVEIDSPLEKIMKMRGVYYNRTDDTNVSPVRHVGVIAQEVETVLPEVVLTDTSEAKHKSVAYGNIVALLIEGMKAQQSTIEGMQAILSSRT